MNDDDPYFSMVYFGVCGPLALVYTCFIHSWLAIISKISNGNANCLQQLKKTPIVPHFPLKLTRNPASMKKLAIITGSNTGIGYETAKRLVKEYGWDVILACRSKDKALIARNKINCHDKNNCDSHSHSHDDVSNGEAIVLGPVLDLSDFNSIRIFVDAVQKEYDNVDVLINNAGRNTSGRSSGNPNLDLMFQSNYLGHFLLTRLMLKNKLLLQSSSSLSNGGGGGGDDGGGNKVINLSSVMHHFGGKGDYTDREGAAAEDSAVSITTSYYWKRRALYHDDNDICPRPNNVYAASKLAAILHTVELNRRYGRNSSSIENKSLQPLTAIAVNPGSVNSDIWRNFPRWVRKFIFGKIFLSTVEGSEVIIAAAVQNGLDSKKDSITTNNEREMIIYLQPYANPFSIFGGRWFPDSSSDKNNELPQRRRQSMIPFTEMFGPYVGHLPTTPRLPSNITTTKDAANVLWEVSEDLTSNYSEN